MSAYFLLQLYLHMNDKDNKELESYSKGCLMLWIVFFTIIALCNLLSDSIYFKFISIVPGGLALFGIYRMIINQYNSKRKNNQFNNVEKLEEELNEVNKSKELPPVGILKEEESKVHLQSIIIEQPDNNQKHESIKITKPNSERKSRYESIVQTLKSMESYDDDLSFEEFFGTEPDEETYANPFSKETFVGDTKTEFSIVGFKYHCSPSEIEQLSIGDLLFLRREPDNPKDKNAIAVLRGAKIIAYVRRSDIRLLDYIVPKEHCVACYIEELSKDVIRAFIPEEYEQTVRYLENVLNNVSEDIEQERCPNVTMGVLIPQNDKKAMKEIKAAELEIKQYGHCTYMVTPDLEDDYVEISRSFGPDAFYFGFNQKLIKNYMTETGWGVMVSLDQIDKDSFKEEKNVLLKLSCVLFKEHDKNVVGYIGDDGEYREHDSMYDRIFKKD